MPNTALASQKVFDFDDQRSFAAVTGDHNPMHLDAVAARRTPAGAPVVHGVNVLLWALETFARALERRPPVRKLRARFHKFVYVGETARVDAAEQTDRGLRLSVSVNGSAVVRVVIDFGEPTLAHQDIDPALPLLALPQTALESDFATLLNTRGRLPFATPPERIAALYPAAAAWLTAERLAAMGASTNLVGMVIPGLHSIFGSLAVEMCADARAEHALQFHVTSTDPRFRLVQVSIAGGGLVGTVESIERVPPTEQASMKSLAGVVGPNEFAGQCALVVGGSRGIGELTAKVLATGGAKTIVTYQTGMADAARVSAEIRAYGGVCETIAYDARLPPAKQLAGMSEAPTHMYYFATPPIQARRLEVYSRERLDEFLAVYVDGFQQLARLLRAQRPELSIFFPSSVFVAERPRGMTEYAMAKAAGEILCADLNDHFAPLRVTVSRLPRIATDQTASFVASDSAPALDVMLPLLREVQSWPRPRPSPR